MIPNSVAVIAAASVLAAACAAVDRCPAAPVDPPQGAPIAAAASVPKPTPRLRVEEIARDLRAPWSVAFLPDGRALFTEREGRVRLIERGKLAPEPVLTVPDIKSWTKMGLLGIAIDPRFAANGFVYLAENYGDDSHNFLRVTRYHESGNRLIEPTTLIKDIPAYLNHTGGRLRFSPDGKLYITTGDADRPPLSQDLHSLAGKILRLNPDGSIPADNPFVGRMDAHPAVWSYGHRNPQGLAFQPGTDTLFAPEHGPDGGDEINVIRPGVNFGWPAISHDRTRDGMVSPLLQYTPSIGPAAATFYTGDLIPSLNGDLLVACLRGEGLLRVQLDGQRVTSAERLLHREHGRLREVAIAPDGAIWVTTSEFDPPEGRRREGYDKILRLTPTGETTTTRASASEAAVARRAGPAAAYAARCAGCHGEGTGPALHSSLFDGRWTLGASDDDLRRVIRDGVVERGMPAYGGAFTDAEIGELVRFIRQREQQGPGQVKGPK